MPTCPQCTKPLAELTRRCPSCMADLDLLVEYVGQLQTGLERAQILVRAGELDLAVWAYLEVLEVDPDNAEARRQVGRVATAVRQFDRVAPGRRWIAHERGEDPDEAANRVARWLRGAFVVLLVLSAFALGYGWGSRSGDETSPGKPQEPPKLKEPREKGLMGTLSRTGAPLAALRGISGRDRICALDDRDTGRNCFARRAHVGGGGA